MINFTDESVMTYAEWLAEQTRLPVVLDETVPVGMIIVDTSLLRLSVHPESKRRTLRQNAEQGQILPPNR